MGGGVAAARLANKGATGKGRFEYPAAEVAVVENDLGARGTGAQECRQEDQEGRVAVGGSSNRKSSWHTFSIGSVNRKRVADVDDRPFTKGPRFHRKMSSGAPPDGIW